MAFDAFMAEHGQPLHCEAGDTVFRQGDNCDALFLVRSGLLKASYLSDAGRETIKSFIREGELIGSLAAAWRGEPTPFGLMALEPTSMIRVPFGVLYEASQNSLPIARATTQFLLGFAMKKERRERDFLTATPETRYRMLMRDSPDLLERVTQKDIARYLGITPVALSRIRRRL